jgi:hypothetical protein
MTCGNPGQALSNQYSLNFCCVGQGWRIFLRTCAQTVDDFLRNCLYMWKCELTSTNILDYSSDILVPLISWCPGQLPSCLSLRPDLLVAFFQLCLNFLYVLTILVADLRMFCYFPSFSSVVDCHDYFEFLYRRPSIFCLLVM